MELEQALQQGANQPIVSSPQFFRLGNTSDQEQLSQLLSTGNILHTIDEYENQLEELFSVNRPDQIFQPSLKEQFATYLEQQKAKRPLWQQGVWVFFPWRGALMHILEEDDFQKVRFARNQNLITRKEQQAFYNSSIGIAGLSVGNSVALNIVLEGGAKHIRLADFDTLDLSNLNRIRGSITNLGRKKVEMSAQQIYEINPYAQVTLFDDGVTEENIERFFDQSPKLDLVIDEIDSLAIKVLLRQEAKKRKLPLLMAADNGENGLVEIERYDQKDVAFFNGRLGDISYEELKGVSKQQTGQLIAKYVGYENIPLRMLQSLGEMGKTIVSWPQLGGPALLNGAALALCARRILNNQPLIPERAKISLDELFIPQEDYQNEMQEQQAFLQRMQTNL